MRKTFIMFLFSIVVAISLFIEFTYKKQEIYDEKIYDFNLQYEDKLVSNQRVVEVLFDDVLQDLDVQMLLADVNNGKNIEENRQKL